ncbi:MAG TPA: magnesium transporter, partial [Candidatus Wunengus sp. YC61]|uniref:magnesium transporter n=1 Tax=Candidatus Wunengus sp. YC61 TaxID=3367698 RepID=UPI004028A661
SRITGLPTPKSPPKRGLSNLMDTTPLHDTAGSHLVKQVPRAYVTDTVSSALSVLPGRFYDSTDAIYIVDDSGRLQGLVRLSQVLAADAALKMNDLMVQNIPMVSPDDDQEQVALLAMKYDITSIPVVDVQKRLLGVVPPQALFEILRREHIEDLNRLVGIWKENNRALSAIEASPTQRVRDRLPWLLLGLMGSMVAGSVVARFEHTLETRISVAFFMPIIVYLADAIGTQTEAVAVRGLSLSHTPIKHLLAGELRTGLLMGLLLGILIFPYVFLTSGDTHLALAVALAVVAAGGFATTIGFLLPWLLFCMGKDPAFGSGPVATIIQDKLSILIYFLVVSVLVM